MSNIVYSTDPDWKKKCEICGNPFAECNCIKPSYVNFKNQTAFLRREKKGRKGKTVSLISNLKGDLKSLQKELQKKCASGGALKKGTIEIQGDQFNKIKSVLQEKGCIVKQVGG
jgi:translation initiation factor 1